MDLCGVWDGSLGSTRLMVEVLRGNMSLDNTEVGHGGVL